jgi:hypothetical protein
MARYMQFRTEISASGRGDSNIPVRTSPVKPHRIATTWPRARGREQHPPYLPEWTIMSSAVVMASIRASSWSGATSTP